MITKYKFANPIEICWGPGCAPHTRTLSHIWWWSSSTIWVTCICWGPFILLWTLNILQETCQQHTRLLDVWTVSLGNIVSWFANSRTKSGSGIFYGSGHFYSWTHVFQGVRYLMTTKKAWRCYTGQDANHHTISTNPTFWRIQICNRLSDLSSIINRIYSISPISGHLKSFSID